MKSNKVMDAAYLYADGHAVIIYEKFDDDAGRVQFVEVHEKFTNARLDFQGRLVLHRYHAEGYLRLARMAKAVEAKERSRDHGSDKTQAMNLTVGYLTFRFQDEFAGYADAVTFQDIGSDGCSIISTGYNYQPETSEAFDPQLSSWCNHRVARVHYSKPPKTVVKVA